MVSPTSKVNETTRILSAVKQSESVIIYVIEAMSTAKIMTNSYSKV